jgi:hypothetical protein
LLLLEWALTVLNLVGPSVRTHLDLSYLARSDKLSLQSVGQEGQRNLPFTDPDSLPSANIFKNPLGTLSGTYTFRGKKYPESELHKLVQQWIGQR